MKHPLAIAVALTVVRCNGGSVGDGGHVVDCTAPPPPSDAGPVPNAPCTRPAPRVYVTTTSDYQTGSLCRIASDTLAVEPALVPTAGDTVLGFHGSAAVLLNYNAASQDNISLVDRCASPPMIGCQLPLHRDCETGAADARAYLAIDARRGYVARLLQPTLAVVDPVACSDVGSIDLSALRGSAPLPDPRILLRVGTEVWAVLERLPPGLVNPWSPGVIAVIDPSHDALVDLDPASPGVQGIQLQFPNPVGHGVVRAHDVLLACVGDFHDATDGAVESVDIATHRSNGALVRETDVGGNIDAVVPLDDDRLLLRVSTAAAPGTSLEIDHTALVVWSLSARTMTPWLHLPSYRITEPVLANGRVFVGDEGDPAAPRPAGVLVFDATTGAAVGARLDCGLPPYDLAVEPP